MRHGKLAVTECNDEKATPGYTIFGRWDRQQFA